MAPSTTSNTRRLRVVVIIAARISHHLRLGTAANTHCQRSLPKSCHAPSAFEVCGTGRQSKIFNVTPYAWRPSAQAPCVRRPPRPQDPQGCSHVLASTLRRVATSAEHAQRALLNNAAEHHLLQQSTCPRARTTLEAQAPASTPSSPAQLQRQSENKPPRNENSSQIAEASNVSVVCAAARYACARRRKHAVRTHVKQ